MNTELNPSQVESLRTPPPDAELKRRSQSGRSLTYIEGRWCIDQMNTIFGPLGWARQFTGSGLRVVDKSEVPAEKGTRHDVAMTCEYMISLPGSAYVAADVGYGIGQSYQGWGDAFESAAKEAVTDALKRCCRSLGNALGNCLYDKEWLKKHQREQEAAINHNGELPPEDAEEPTF